MFLFALFVLFVLFRRELFGPGSIPSALLNSPIAVLSISANACPKPGTKRNVKQPEHTGEISKSVC